MSVAHLLLGIASLAFGAAMILLRHRLHARHSDARRAAVPPAMWLLVGTILTANGVLQVVLAAS